MNHSRFCQIVCFIWAAVKGHPDSITSGVSIFILKVNFAILSDFLLAVAISTWKRVLTATQIHDRKSWIANKDILKV